MKKINTSRRDFLMDSTRAGLAIGFGLTVGNNLKAEPAGRQGLSYLPTTPFDQQPLPYAYNALEPVIDATTMEIHYTKHAAAYAKNLKEAAAAEKVDTSKPVEHVLANVSKYSMKMRNNAGGHCNHELFWKSMRPRTDNNKPSGKLLKRIEEDFSSFENFKTQFSDAAKSRFGSGWAWLVELSDKKLKIGSTPNQDNSLMDLSELKGFPVLGLDVWEHAYYLKYQNRRPEYIENWWNVVNWDFIAERFDKRS